MAARGVLPGADLARPAVGSRELVGALDSGRKHSAASFGGVTKTEGEEVWDAERARAFVVVAPSGRKLLRDVAQRVSSVVCESRTAKLDRVGRTADAE